MDESLDERGRWSLVLPHRDRLIQLVRTRLAGHPVADAEDVAHETLLRAATFPGLDPERVGPFLTTVALRQCADLHRAKAREASALRRAHTPYPSEDVAEAVCDSLQGAWLMREAAALPGQQAAVMIATAHGEERAHTAVRLGATLKALESAAARARRSLRATATLGISVFGVIARRRVVRLGMRHRGVAGAGAAVAMATAVTLLPAWTQTPGQAIAAPPNGHAWSARHHHWAPVVDSIHQRRPSGNREALEAPSHPVGRGDGSTDGVKTMAATPPVPGPLHGTGASVQHSHPDKNVVESLEDCINGGLQIGPSMIGCP